jgi:hypothetical protein
MAHLIESGRVTLENLREMEETLTRIESGEGKEASGEKGKGKRKPASKK